jgi:hypothetical protein
VNIEPSDIFTFIAMACIIFVVVKGRKRVRCLEAELARKKLDRTQENPTEPYQENRLVKIIDLIREQEARMQNRAILMELLIEDADERIAKLSGSPPTTSRLQSPSFKKDFLSMTEKGLSDEEIARAIGKQPWVVELLRDTWINNNS